MRVLVTGATGFIGRRLLSKLQRPAVLSRDPQRAAETLAAFGVTAHSWDAVAGQPPPEALEGIDTVIHLAGDPVADRRWNAEKKQAIRDSRVIGTRHLVDAIARRGDRPRTLVSCSAVGYYGDRGDETLDERSGPGSDFLAQVCVDWEAEALRAADLGVRVVIVRIGVVLGRDGGALAKMLTPFRMGFGGRLASGRQWMPWIHVDDVAGLLYHAAISDHLYGPMNGTAPNPVTNREFTKALGNAVHRRAIFPVPAAVLKLLVGEFAQIVLASQKIVPGVALVSGYQFAYPEIEGALTAIVAER